MGPLTQSSEVAVKKFDIYRASTLFTAIVAVALASGAANKF